MTSDTYILPTVPSGVSGLTNEQSRALNERLPQSRSTVDRCITCMGRKRFRWFAPGSRTEEVEYTCPCPDQHRLARRFWYSGVFRRYQKLGWADFVQLDDQTAAGVVGYIDNLDMMVRSGFGLTLTGPKGTGKTLLGHLIIKEVIGKGVDAYATSFNSMIDQYAQGWKNDEMARWFDRRVRDAAVLLIDDLGREYNKGEGTVGEKMFEAVIRHRVACQLPTILTSNHSPQEIRQLYGTWTGSLLDECSIEIFVPGVDQRSRMNQREQEYIQRGLIRPVTIG